MRSHYILIVYGGIELELHGPYKTMKGADQAARYWHKKTDPDTDSIFWINGEDEHWNLSCGSYSSSFFNKGE